MQENVLARATCPECGKEFSRNHLGNHRRNQHGVYGGRTGRVRRQAPVSRRQPKAPQQAPSKLIRYSDLFRGDQSQLTMLGDVPLVTDGKRYGLVIWLDL